MSEVLKAESLVKDYPLPRGNLRVLDGLDFTLAGGDIAAVMGVSGVGKTTFLNLIAGLDTPTSGKVYLDREDLFALDERRRAVIRNAKVGFIFQFYHLLPEFTALENVALPLLIGGKEKKDAYRLAGGILREVFLEDRAMQRPGKLSGGEQQRVAIARALVNEPRVLLADEPTGNLDWKTGKSILELIRSLHARKSLSSVIVTHNEKVAEYCDRVYMMEGGRLKLLSPP